LSSLHSTLAASRTQRDDGLVAIELIPGSLLIVE